MMPVYNVCIGKRRNDNVLADRERFKRGCCATDLEKTRITVVNCFVIVALHRSRHLLHTVDTVTTLRTSRHFNIDDLCEARLITDALLRLFRTHYRTLSLTVTLLLCSSLGWRHSSSPGLSLFPLLSSTLPGPSASEVPTLWCLYKYVYYYCYYF